jgi:nucleotide-binding universal stress UspA family protein
MSIVFKKMLIAVDGSPCSENAAKKGLELAVALQIPVALFSVIDRSQEIIPTDLEVKPIQTGSFLQEQARKNIRQIMEKYIAKSMEGHVHEVFTEGLPREEILLKLKEWDAEVLVVGTHGRKGLAHLLLGSTAEYLVRHAKVPVLVVPYEGKDL